MDNSFQQLIRQLPPWFSTIAGSVPAEVQPHLTELRLFLDKAPLWVQNGRAHIYSTHRLTRQELDEIFYTVCRGSVHSFRQEICQGFVTLEGGQRVGLCGTAVYHGGELTGLRDITSMNIRFARQVKGCARELHQRMKELGLEEGSFLLAGPPGCGKTTILRDYVRILAGGDGGDCRMVAVLDERGELSAFDLGMSAHVLKGIPKERAILQALRTLAPRVIACDEIGSVEEAKLLISGLNAGSCFIGTIHADCWKTLKSKPQFRPFLEQRAIDALVFLEAPGQIQEIRRMREGYDETAWLRPDRSLCRHGGDFAENEAGATDCPVAENA